MGSLSEEEGLESSGNCAAGSSEEEGKEAEKNDPKRALSVSGDQRAQSPATYDALNPCQPLRMGDLRSAAVTSALCRSRPRAREWTAPLSHTVSKSLHRMRGGNWTSGFE